MLSSRAVRLVWILLVYVGWQAAPKAYLSNPIFFSSDNLFNFSGSHPLPSVFSSLRNHIIAILVYWCEWTKFDTTNCRRLLFQFWWQKSSQYLLLFLPILFPLLSTHDWFIFHSRFSALSWTTPLRMSHFRSSSLTTAPVDVEGTREIFATQNFRRREWDALVILQKYAIY
jgi:hypothetical protein